MPKNLSLQVSPECSSGFSCFLDRSRARSYIIARLLAASLELTVEWSRAGRVRMSMVVRAPGLSSVAGQEGGLR